MTVDSENVIRLDPTNLKFSVFSAEDVKKISVAKIVSSTTFDSIGHALPGGLYDPAMGPCSFDEYCATCVKGLNKCEGHFGHIDLCSAVFNPFFIKTVYNILRIICLSCYKLQIDDNIKSLLELQLNLVDSGYIVEAQEIEIYKSKFATKSISEMPEEIAEYHEMMLKEPYNKLFNTKNSEAIRTAIVNATVKDCVRKTCIHCKTSIQRVKFSYKRLVFHMSKEQVRKFYENIEAIEDGKVKSTNKVIFADECQKYFHKLYANDGSFLTLLFPILKNSSATMSCPIDLFFMDVFPVTPPIVRPANKVRDQLLEHPQTLVLKNILKANTVLRAVIDNVKANKESRAPLLAESVAVFKDTKGDSSEEKLCNAWIDLQNFVDQSLDANLSPDKNRDKMAGLKQIIEKKEGLIRMHMMGKRVNFAARTVITPDPNIGVEEIGIPEKFATRLTYPVPVTPWNVAELRKMVINGPDVYPGACLIESANGICSKISSDNKTQRASLAKTLLTPQSSTSLKGAKIVHRHLKNGDMLLLNRQPTLHKPSIMAHKARILKGEKTFRLHYSNCKSYNADFDGDEMNAHFPQNELARSEAYNIVNVPNQYLVPKDGTPLGGLIQDHIISGVKLFIRGRFYNREDYQQLVFQGLSHIKGNINLLPPTILRPKVLYSGKHIISTIIQNITPKDLPNINLSSKSKLSETSWQLNKKRPWKAGGSPLQGNEMSESEVIIRNGELLSGILDKNHFGATPYGLIHCIYELYGGECSTQLLSALSRLFTYFLQWEGFTLGVHDILVVEDAERQRTEIIKKCRNSGHAAAAAALELPSDVPLFELSKKMEDAYIKNPNFRAILDRQYKTSLDSFTNDINKTCLPKGLVSKFPDNNLQLMVQSGAKGSTVNTMQISCLLGQIELEGKRPPLMISGKSLPSFTTFETSPKSGGFIDGRFMTGIQPQDFFFHCMAGREGLIDTAVKTSRSGYLQRCLVKHLEGLNVNYDMTVRDSDNSIVQFMYGEDGMDISKSQFLKKEQLKFLDENRDVIVQEDTMEKLQNDDEVNEQLKQHIKKLKSWRKKHGFLLQKRRVSGFKEFSAEMKDEISVSNPTKRKNKTGRTKLDAKLIKKWNNLDSEAKESYNKKCMKPPEPLISKLKPDNCLGSITEYMENLINGYVRDNQHKKEVQKLMNVKSITSLAAPGEPVGMIAAQSIGEPSTQMTLNTFHFAGRGEMNVTLGIPRLREILMMASKNLKTPSMEIPFLKHKNPKKLEAIAEKMRKTLNKVTVADVLETINIKSRLVLKPSRGMEHIIRFKFLPQQAYSQDYLVEPKEIIKYMNEYFFKYMFKAIYKKQKAKNILIEIEADSTKKNTTASVENDNDADEKEPEARSGIKDEDSSDDEPAAEDADATESRLKGRRADEKDYDEEEDENSLNKSRETDDEDYNDETEDLIVKETEPKEDDFINEEVLDRGKIQLNEKDERKKVFEKDSSISDYKFDKKDFLWCEIQFHMPVKMKNIDFSQVFKDIVGKCVIWEVPKINRAITFLQNEQLMLKTDGINIFAMSKYIKILDLQRLYSNDIHAIAETYGIEAANKVIVKEVQNVFNVYGITIDPRHLLLIADYMTCDGSFMPMSRRGMESSASPLQQMSFESSLQFLKSAALKGCEDNLNSPSSRLIVGQLCKSGTGCFSLFNSNFVPNAC